MDTQVAFFRDSMLLWQPGNRLSSGSPPLFRSLLPTPSSLTHRGTRGSWGPGADQQCQRSSLCRDKASPGQATTSMAGLGRPWSGLESQAEFLSASLPFPGRSQAQGRAPCPSLESGRVPLGKFHSGRGCRTRELGSGDGKEGWDASLAPSPTPPLG